MGIIIKMSYFTLTIIISLITISSELELESPITPSKSRLLILWRSWTIDINTINGLLSLEPDTYYADHLSVEPEITSFDFYGNKTMYYSIARDNSKLRLIFSSSSNYTNLALTPPYSSYGLRCLAVDYRSKKIYIYDIFDDKIDILDIEGKYTNIVLSELADIKDIALDPIQGYMFILRGKYFDPWSEILIANMDGTDLKVLINESNITAFTLNVRTGVLYWCSNNEIKGYDYTNNKYLIKSNFSEYINDKEIIISLAVLIKNQSLLKDVGTDRVEYHLYFTDNVSLYRCTISYRSDNVCDNVEHIPTWSFLSGGILKLKAYDPSIQSDLNNPCEYDNGGCEHLCVLTSKKLGKGYSCACNIGWQLREDLKSCSPVEDFIMYKRGDYFFEQILDLSRKSFVHAIRPKELWVNYFQNFDYNAHKGYIVAKSERELLRLELPWRAGQDIAKKHLAGQEYILYPTVDWVSDNLYYLDVGGIKKSLILRQPIQDDNIYYSYQHKVIYTFEKEKLPQSLVIEPNLGYLFVAVYNKIIKRGQIYRMNLDGSDMTIFSRENESISTEYLAIDQTSHRLYWLNESKTTISHTSLLNSSQVGSVKISFINNPINLDVYGDWIYTNNYTDAYRVDKRSGEFVEKILPTEQWRNLSSVRIYSKNKQPISLSNPCAIKNGGCIRYCLAVNSKITNQLEKICACNDNELLMEDGKNCESAVYSEEVTD